MASKKDENLLEADWQSEVITAASMLHSLRSRPEFCDVVFRVGMEGQTKEISAHR